jgi:hypothetical protein
LDEFGTELARRFRQEPAIHDERAKFTAEERTAIRKKGETQRKPVKTSNGLSLDYLSKQIDQSLFKDKEDEDSIWSKTTLAIYQAMHKSQYKSRYQTTWM